MSDPLPAPGPSTPSTRWEEWVAVDDRWEAYSTKFAGYFVDGADMDGEARFVDMLVARASTVLDAGCGPGRVTAGLTARGHRAVGVDKDAGLVSDGHGRYPGLPLHVRDLLTVEPEWLAAQDLPTEFDAIVCPGNVMVFVAPGTERDVLGRLGALLRPGGRAVFGFSTDREYTVDGLDADAAAVGWTLEHRFATWHLDPFTADAGWAVSVYRSPGEPAVPAGPDGRRVLGAADA